MRLGEQLVEENLVDRARIDEALRQQVLLGGRLGTNLVEGGAIGLDALAEALGRQHHLPAALHRHFDAADPILQRALPLALASELSCVPVAAPGEWPVPIAFLDPPGAGALARVRDRLARDILPVVAPELRLLFQLERIYGVARPNRYKRIPPTLDSQASALPGADRRHYITSLDAGDPDQLRRTALGRVAVTRRRVSRPPRHPRPSGHEEVLQAIRLATDRDAAAGAAAGWLRDGFDAGLGAGILFVVRGKLAVGWKGFTRDGDEGVVDSIAIPLDAPSVLELSYATGVLVCGTPPPAGRALDERLWALLGCGAPTEIAVVPLAIRDQVVCLLYAHAADLGSMAEVTVHRIADIGDALSAAFRRLMAGHER